MGLLQQNVIVKWGNTAKEHYISKGYKYTHHGDEFLCDVNDLTHCSNVKVLVQCDFCGQIKEIEYRGYLRLRSDKYCCPDCLSHKKKTRDDNGKLVFIEIPYRNKEWLYQEYIVKDRLAEDIARECGINHRTLREWISIHGLPTKRKNIGEKITKEELEYLYLYSGLSSKEIGEMYGVSDTTILYVRRKFGIRPLTQSEVSNRYYYKRGGIEKSREIEGAEQRRIMKSCRQRGISVEDFDEFSTTESHRIRNSCEYDDWRKSVFARDNYVCQHCGKKSHDLQAHHIINFSEDKSLRFDINNGISFCRECHAPGFNGSFHDIYGCHNNTKEQLDEFLSVEKEMCI